MAIVDTHKNLVFIHIYKTAGKSVRKALNLSNRLEVGGVHCNAIDTMEALSKNGRFAEWDDAFKFSFVRNPYDWCVSLYFYIKNSPGHNYHNLFKDKNFAWFIDWLIKDAMHFDKPFTSNKYQTLTEFLCDKDGKLLMDFVGRMEEFNVGMNHLLARWDIKLAEIPKIEVRGTNRDVMSMYPPFIREKVRERFADDFKMFKYKL